MAVEALTGARPLLICEGACNPDIAAIDQAIVVAVMQRDKLATQEATGDEHLWEWQRTLLYTQHKMIAPHTAQCTICHTVRRYGA